MATREALDEAVAGLHGQMATREALDAGVAGLRREIAASTAETRRHFGVIADGLMAKIELVGEGVRVNGERLDRFQGEVQAQFAAVDRRFLGLQARLGRRRRP
jgi:hypothetical protein